MPDAIFDPDALFHDNRRLAYYLATRIWRARHTVLEMRGHTVEDLKQVALLALFRAAREFDAARGCKFSTFAHPVIHHELLTLACRGGRVALMTGVLPDIPRVDPDALDPAAVLLAEEQNARLAVELPDRIQLLPPVVRSTIERLAQGKRRKEIAREDGVCPRAIHERVRRARQYLRDLRRAR